MAHVAFVCGMPKLHYSMQGLTILCKFVIEHNNLHHLNLINFDKVGIMCLDWESGNRQQMKAKSFSSADCGACWSAPFRNFKTRIFRIFCNVGLGLLITTPTKFFSSETI